MTAIHVYIVSASPSRHLRCRNACSLLIASAPFDPDECLPARRPSITSTAACIATIRLHALLATSLHCHNPVSSVQLANPVNSIEQSGMARRSKKRRTDAAAAGPSAAFLAALESQRANARLREQQAAPAAAPEPSEPSEPVETPAPSQHKHLPGFYFDAAKQRYFRCAPEQRRKQARSMKIRLEPGRSAPPSSSASAAIKSAAPRRRPVFALASHSSLQACLDRRQQSYAWSASGGDQRVLKPRFLGQFFVR